MVENLPPETSLSAPSVCVVAIVRDELPFIDEWLAYHRLLGVGHFYLYDDDPALPLKKYLQPHADYVTVIDWFGKSARIPGLNRQTKAYLHALPFIQSHFKWVAYIDIDEFISLASHPALPGFLADYESFGAVSLPWHLFGHNGYFQNPPGFVTSSLTRRMRQPADRSKSITKTAAITDIRSAHRCILRPGFGTTVDPNKRVFAESVYPGKSKLACVNHYMCRSFDNWMGRVERGSVLDDVMHIYPENDWRLTREGCLRRFVEHIAKDANEFVDESMLRFIKPIERFLEERGVCKYSTAS